MNGSDAHRTFRCFIHPRPPAIVRGPTVAWEGRPLATLEGATLVPSGFDCTYDEVAAKWRSIAGLVLEPDGSFAWVGKDVHGGQGWHLEGQLTDAGPSVAVVELAGHCTASQLDRILQSLGWPEVSVIFQLRDLGVFVDEHEFRTRVFRAGDDRDA